jgi:hypothetical protein
MSKIGILREIVDYMTSCPLCGEVSLSVFASDEDDASRTVVACEVCDVRIECALGTLRHDEVRRALGTLTHDPTPQCGLSRRALCSTQPHA